MLHAITEVFYAKPLTTQEKQILARAAGIQKEIWGYYHTFFRDNQATIMLKSFDLLSKLKLNYL